MVRSTTLTRALEAWLHEADGVRGVYEAVEFCVAVEWHGMISYSCSDCDSHIVAAYSLVDC